MGARTVGVVTAGALQWLTLAAAVIAAAGSIISPVLVYRAAVRELTHQQQETERARRQERIDQAVAYALSDDDTIALMGVKVLDFMLENGELDEEQRASVVAAIEASVDRSTRAGEPAD